MSADAGGGAPGDAGSGSADTGGGAPSDAGSGSADAGGGAPVGPSPYRTAVDEAWLDYNGHVTDSAYAVIAAAANEAWCAVLNMGEEYRRRTGCGLYTAQLTIRYRHEVTAADVVSACPRLTRLGNSSLTVSCRLTARDAVVAEAEHVYVHVDSAGDGAVPFTVAQRARLEPLLDVDG